MSLLSERSLFSNRVERHQEGEMEASTALRGGFSETDVILQFRQSSFAGPAAALRRFLGAQLLNLSIFKVCFSSTRGKLLSTTV